MDRIITILPGMFGLQKVLTGPFGAMKIVTESCCRRGERQPTG
jgi:hypothetical protein